MSDHSISHLVLQPLLLVTTRIHQALARLLQRQRESLEIGGPLCQLVRQPHRGQRQPCRASQLLEQSSVEGRLLGAVHRDLDLAKRVTGVPHPDRERIRAGSDRRRPYL
jgi:hypothetical protein